MGVPAACSTLVGNTGQGRQLAAHRPPCLIAAAQPPACAVPLLLCSWNGCSNQDFALSTNGTLDVLQYLACELHLPPAGGLCSTLPCLLMYCSSQYSSAVASLTLCGVSLVSSRGSGRSTNAASQPECLPRPCLLRLQAPLGCTRETGSTSRCWSVQRTSPCSRWVGGP
jgi:hypothetical protein